MAEPLKVVVSDDVETIHVDPDTGTVTETQPDGGVVVRLDAKKPRDDEAGEDEWYRNLVDDIDGIDLGIIADDLHQAISADDTSRSEWLQNTARGLTLMGLKLENPKSSVGDSTSGIEGMSVVTNPLLAEACFKGWANAQAELLPSNGPAKIAVDGDETKLEDEMAEKLQDGFNHYLTKTAKEYYPETSHMLLWGTYAGGSGFKKVYRCPMLRRPVSRKVDAKDLIVSDSMTDFASCGRITHEITMRPSVMKRMQLIGAYRKADMAPPNVQPSAVDEKIAGIQGTQAAPTRPEDQPYTLWEAQCELDIPEFAPGKFKDEGIPIPYIVTIDKESRQVLSIRRDWKEDDDDCKRQQMYVKYPYIPGPGFYGTGMVSMLGNCTAAMTAAWREALDAGMFANFPAFLMAKLGGRQNSATIRLGPGEAQGIETNGLPIGQIITALPYKDVTPGLLALIDKITAQAKGLGASVEIPTGEGVQNVPVGTMMAQIEQATKVMAAAHKGMHTAQSEEFDLLVELFRQNPEDFWKSSSLDDQKDYWTEELLLEALNDHKLVPSSDPNIPSHIHRLAKAVALAQLADSPSFGPLTDKKEAYLRILHGMKEDPTGLVIDPPPGNAQPDPAIVAKMADVQVKREGNQIKAADIQQKSQDKQADLAQQKDIKTVDLTKELIIHKADSDKVEASEIRSHAMEQRQQHLAEQQHGLDVDKHAHDLMQTGVAAHESARDHGLALGQHALEANTAAQQAAVAVHQAITDRQKAKAKPPAPKAKK